MLSLYCLITGCISIMVYLLFTLNYPINNNNIKCNNYTKITIVSICNHLIFLLLITTLLLIKIRTFDDFKKYIFIPVTIIQSFYIMIGIYIINNSICSTYHNLVNYYEFMNIIYWLSLYCLYFKLCVNYLFE